MEIHKRLYSEEKTIQEDYCYKINRYGSHESEAGGDVRIVFVNGKFSHVNHPFPTMDWTQAQWEVLEAISRKIREI